MGDTLARLLRSPNFKPWTITQIFQCGCFTLKETLCKRWLNCLPVLWCRRTSFILQGTKMEVFPIRNTLIVKWLFWWPFFSTYCKLLFKKIIKSSVDFYIAFSYLRMYLLAVSVVAVIVFLADVPFLCISHQREERGDLLGSSQMLYSHHRVMVSCRRSYIVFGLKVQPCHERVLSFSEQTVRKQGTKFHSGQNVYVWIKQSWWCCAFTRTGICV